MTDRHRLALEAICTDLRRKNPRWSEKRVRSEAKIIHQKRMAENA